MKPTIYIMLNFQRMEEVTKNPNLRKTMNYLSIVFNSGLGPNGFLSNSIGELFLTELVLNTVLWNYKSQCFVSYLTKEQILNDKFKFNGLLFKPTPEILDAIDEVDKQKKLMQKNKLYERYGKQIVNFEPSLFFSYEQKDLKMDNLSQLYNKYNDFIMFDSGEFNLYFHVFSKDIESQIDRISSIANKLHIPVQIVNDDSDVPSW